MAEVQASDGSSCPSCGDTFESVTGMRIHHSQIHGKSIAYTEVECSNCGQSLTRSKVRAEKREDFFCSSEDCLSEWAQDNRSGEDHPNWSDNTIICEYCGEEKHRRPSHVSDKNFCNETCKNNWQSENKKGEKSNLWEGGEITTKCHWCGGNVDKKPSQIKDRNFCNRECVKKWQEKAFLGPNNPAWSGGKEVYNILRNQTLEGCSWDRLSDEVRQSYGYTCELCGKEQQEEHRSLDVHHIIPVVFGGVSREENLVCVCQSCHWKSEKYIRDRLPVQPINEIIEDM